MAGVIIGAVGAVVGIVQAIASVCPTHREITIEIENATQCYCLINPRFYLDSGGCRKPLPMEIEPATSDNAVFAKTPNTARGSVGVFTYDLSLNGSVPTKKMAVTFSVPYDFNLYNNWFAVGVFSSNRSCNKDLYCEMDDKINSCFVRGKAADGILKYEHKDVVIKASMSDCYTPYMKLKVKEI